MSVTKSVPTSENSELQSLISSINENLENLYVHISQLEDKLSFVSTNDIPVAENDDLKGSEYSSPVGQALELINARVHNAIIRTIGMNSKLRI